MVVSRPGGSSWPVESGQRVGAFLLGMGVNEALAVIQKMGSLDRAEFCFDERRIFDVDLSLRLPSLGLQLCFDGFQQDLRVIVVQLRAIGSTGTGGGELADEGERYRPDMLPSLTYGGRVFAGPRRPALCFRDLYSMFGPTWIGDFRVSEPTAYYLRYPGLTFEFPLPPDMIDALAAKGEHPMDIPGHPPPTAARMWVLAKDSPSFMHPVSAQPDGPEDVVVRPATGVELRGRTLRFGSMPQDVFSDFGPPEQVCVKDVDAVRIHSASTLPPRLTGPDYYYNYFHLGLDVLFDGRSHLVKKVILHTNPPMHELFSRYTRCFFHIPLGSSTETQAPLSQGVRASVSAATPLDSAVLLSSSPHAATALDSAVLPSSSPQGRGGDAIGGDLVLPPAAAEAERGGNAISAEAAESTAACGESKGAGCAVESLCDADEDVTPQGDGLDEYGWEERSGRRISKRERKALRQKRKKDARDGATSPGTSPVISLLSTSPEPSPLLAALCDNTATSAISSELCRAVAATAADAGGWDELPPPAMPLDRNADALGSGFDLDGFVDDPCGDEAQAEPLFGAGSLCAPAVGDVCIDVKWPWPQIQEVLEHATGCGSGRPLVVNQSGHTPFGSTFFYALPGLAFEVMQNGFVASLTVFSVPPDSLPTVFQ
mmetsp:Transcript_56837/g.158298  ORF Transcript_56837/g.158298 Transcript_56837/m.158298 type:complete len:657 (+) Transcript_56837:80-2050(+)